MEFIWTTPLFILPIVTFVFFAKGLGGYQRTKDIKKFKNAFLSLIATIIYYSVVMYTNTDSTNHFEQKVVGNYRSADTKSIRLFLNPNHTFTVDKKIRNRFFGDGNWGIELDDFVLVTLKFDNGENLRLKFTPNDSTLIGDNEVTEKIAFNKYRSNVAE